jgi:hypothetical protein
MTHLRHLDGSASMKRWISLIVSKINYKDWRFQIHSKGDGFSSSGDLSTERSDDGRSEIAKMPEVVSLLSRMRKRDHPDGL